MVALGRYLLGLSLLILLTACGQAALTPNTVINAPSGVGIKGFDPVSYHTDGKAKRGDSKHQTEHEGVVYRFAEADNKRAFEEEPDRYLPAYGGYCAYAMSNGDIVDINPRNWRVIDGRLYLNANIFAQGLFAIDTNEKISEADEHWTRLSQSVATP